MISGRGGLCKSAWNTFRACSVKVTAALRGMKGCFLPFCAGLGFLAEVRREWRGSNGDDDGDDEEEEEWMRYLDLRGDILAH